VLTALVGVGTFTTLRGRGDIVIPPALKPASRAAVEEAEVIAILPFVSIGATTGNSYLAEGLTNALAGRLSRAAGLNVVTPSRAVAFVNASNAKGATNDKNVVVLEGAVEKNGNTIRVSA